MASSRHSDRTKNLRTHILNYNYEAERVNLSWWRLLNSKPCPQWFNFLQQDHTSQTSDSITNQRQVFQYLILWGTFPSKSLQYENVKIKPIILYDGWICTNKIIIRLRESLRSKECKKSKSPVTSTGCLIPKWRTEAGDSWQSTRWPLPHTPAGPRSTESTFTFYVSLPARISEICNRCHDCRWWVHAGWVISEYVKIH